MQTIPRVVTYDNATGANILQWPVEEIESLRINSTYFEDIELGPGSIVPLDIGTATQVVGLTMFFHFCIIWCP